MSKPWDVLRKPSPLGKGVFKLPLRVEIVDFPYTNLASVRLGENSTLSIDRTTARALSHFFAELADQLTN